MVREFPPTIFCIVAWCDQKLKETKALAAYKPVQQRLPSPEYSDDHQIGMLARLSRLFHDLFDGKKHQPWVRPIGLFEKPGDKWQQAQTIQTNRGSWRPHTHEELRAHYGQRKTT